MISTFKEVHKPTKELNAGYRGLGYVLAPERILKAKKMEWNT